MNAVRNSNKATAITATGQTRAAAAVRVKLTPQGFSIDYPDLELGEQLMAEALGIADRDAMHGILRQLVKAGVNGQKPDAVNLAFMISMVEFFRNAPALITVWLQVRVLPGPPAFGAMVVRAYTAKEKAKITAGR